MKPAKKTPWKRLTLILLIALFVQFGMPAMSEALLEIYHVTKFEGVYMAYGITRFLDYQLVLWKFRGLIGPCIALVGIALLLRHQNRRPRHVKDMNI